jgi:hypothetical protein
MQRTLTRQQAIDGEVAQDGRDVDLPVGDGRRVEPGEARCDSAKIPGTLLEPDRTMVRYLSGGAIPT